MGCPFPKLVCLIACGCDQHLFHVPICVQHQ
ncbi:Uncharacterised protein [Vibrio cholerae]|nr:Uncharacterised protein [Vibrio cholerae]